MSSLFFQLQEMMREESGRKSRSIPGSRPGVTEEFGFFFDPRLFYTVPGLLVRQGTPISKRKKDFCPRVSRAH